MMKAYVRAWVSSTNRKSPLLRDYLVLSFECAVCAVRHTSSLHMTTEAETIIELIVGTSSREKLMKV